MKEEYRFSINELKKAVKRLSEGIASVKDELDQDGVIQRFEFTIELFWKSLKLYLENEGILCSTPRECLKGAFKIGIIENEEIFLDMLNDRNRMSHIYSQEEAKVIYSRIKKFYVKSLKKISKQLSKR